MTTHHTDEKKPADAGEIAAALKALSESPKFKMRLVLEKLDGALRMLDENLETSREQERYNLRGRLYAALNWLSEVDAKLFPEDQEDYWIRKVMTLHFDNVKAQEDNSD